VAKNVSLLQKSVNALRLKAADIVLAGDNFATIVVGVEKSRAIFSNIRKFLRFNDWLRLCGSGEFGAMAARIEQILTRAISRMAMHTCLRS
jgi:hypothetical protein